MVCWTCSSFFNTPLIFGDPFGLAGEDLSVASAALPSAFLAFLAHPFEQQSAFHWLGSSVWALPQPSRLQTSTVSFVPARESFDGDRGLICYRMLWISISHVRSMLKLAPATVRAISGAHP